MKSAESPASRIQVRIRVFIRCLCPFRLTCVRVSRRFPATFRVADAPGNVGVATARPC